MKFSLAISAVLMAASGAAFATDSPRPSLAPSDNNVLVTTMNQSYFPYYIEFNDLLYVMFLQTSDTSSPVEVNNFEIRFDYNDDPNEFYRIVNLP
jgi:hypothetical protein